MIGKLKGQVDAVYDDHLLLDVGGVGYLVFCSRKTLSLVEENEFVEILIETHVREDHIHLYGFVAYEEKSAFNILQSVKGVGTRMALSILSHLEPAEIQLSLNSEDKSAFHRVPGVGKKLAERIITELKDKVISTKGYDESTLKTSMNALGNNSLSNDAISALTSLGIGKAEAQKRVNNILLQQNDISINDLIRLALKN